MSYSSDINSDMPVCIYDPIDPTLSSQVDSDRNFHVLAFGKDPANIALFLKLSEQGHVTTNGIHDVASNTDPSNMGLICHIRNTSPNDSHQINRITSSKPNLSTIDPSLVMGVDTNAFLKYWNKNTSNWERSTGEFGLLNTHIDGIFSVDNINPSNFGLIAHIRNISPNDSHQINRITSVSFNNIHSLDVSLHDGEGKGIKSYPTSDLGVSDIIDNPNGVYGSITIGTVAVEARVGSQALVGRKSLNIYNKSNKSIFWGLDNNVTINTGVEVYPKQHVVWDISDNTHIWLISDTNNLDVRVVEA